ncbi:MAG TPA: peptidylprolyl isomerase [Rubricoccaceae bacterium]|nr:peptidylprolyl isomerase [Rubricoccaceae bacterium]
MRPALRFAMPFGVFAGALALLAASAPGCAMLAPPVRAPRAVRPDVAAPAHRADGLLARPALQAVVDHQVLRHAAPLIDSLQSTDPAVRARAAFALASVQAPEAVGPLTARLGDGSALVRADAAFALGQTADSTAAPALLGALRLETDSAATAELLDALGKTAGRDALAQVLALSIPGRLEPARALAFARFGLRSHHDARVIDWLLTQLTAPSAPLRARAAYYFGRVPADPWRAEAARVRAAFDALAPGDEARTPLARALGRLRNPDDVPRLTRALRSDNDWRTRTAAAAALGGFLPDPTATDSLVSALGDRSIHVAVAAATALGAAEGLPPAALDRLALHTGRGRRDLVAGALLPALVRGGRLTTAIEWLDRQRDPYTRALGLTALGGASDPGSRERLFALADDADPRLAYAALEALKARWAREPNREMEGPRYYATFARALERKDLATTTSAAPVLADSLFQTYGSGNLLRAVYADLDAPEDIEPMVEIVRAVGQIRDGEEIEFLVGVVLSGHPVLRQAAADALDERLEEGIDVDANNLLAPQTPLIDWAYLAGLGPRPRLVLDTERGRVVVEMDAEQAPQTVGMIARVTEAGEYDGVPFHRVVPNFVVQGGDYFREDGFGGPPTALRSEFTRIRYTTGTAGMASAGKDTEGVQYFLTHSPQPHLDGRYTAFGRVVEGQGVVDQLQQGDRVLHARLVRRPADG